jgi:hypothetical protein
MRWKKIKGDWDVAEEIVVVQTISEANSQKCPFCHQRMGYFFNAVQSILTCIVCKVYIRIKVTEKVHSPVL